MQTKRIIWASSNQHYINLAQNMATYFTLKKKKNYLRLLRIPLTFKKINIGIILYYQRSSKNKCNSVDVVLTVMYFGKKKISSILLAKRIIKSCKQRKLTH